MHTIDCFLPDFADTTPHLRVGDVRGEVDLEHGKASEQLLGSGGAHLLVDDTCIDRSLHTIRNTRRIVLGKVRVLYRDTVEPSNVELAVVEGEPFAPSARERYGGEGQ